MSFKLSKEKRVRKEKKGGGREEEGRRKKGGMEGGRKKEGGRDEGKSMESVCVYAVSERSMNGLRKQNINFPVF